LENWLCKIKTFSSSYTYVDTSKRRGTFGWVIPHHDTQLYSLSERDAI
jgi:hypothetical protein